MPTYNFDTLADLWEKVCNSYSGRSDGSPVPAIPFASWTSWAPSIVGPNLRYRGVSAGINHDFETLMPATDWPGLVAFLTNFKSRRAVVSNAVPPPVPYPNTCRQMIITPATNIRSLLMDMIFPGFLKVRTYVALDFTWILVPGEYSIQVHISGTPAIYGQGDINRVLPGDTYTGSPEVILDLFFGWDVEYYTIGYIPIMSPVDPDLLTWPNALGQFLGYNVIALAGQDLQAIDALAVAMAAAAGGAGSVKTQRGRPLLNIVRQDGELSPYADSADRILLRLGQAANLFTSGAVTLVQTSPPAIVAVDAGVFRDP